MDAGFLGKKLKSRFTTAFMLEAQARVLLPGQLTLTRPLLLFFRHSVFCFRYYR
jgi:hypothetical protein